MARTKLEVIEERNSVREKIERAIAAGETEKRMLNETETSYLDTLKTRLAELDAEERDIETAIINTKTNEKIENRHMENLLTIIQNKLNGKVNSEATQAFLDRGTEEMRALGISGDINLPTEFRGELVVKTDASGGYTVQTDVERVMQPLFAVGTLANAGAQFITLQRPTDFPAISKSNIFIADEVAQASDASLSFSKPLSLKGYRLTAYCDLSNSLIKQSATDNISQVIADNLGQALREKVESAILSDTSYGPGVLEGLFINAVDCSDGVTFADITAMDEDVEENNMTIQNFIGSPHVKSVLRSTLRDASNAASGYIMPNATELDGRNFQVNSNAAGLLGGDFSQLVVANFGGISLTIDPVSRAIYNETRIVINTLVDWGVKRPGAFSAITV